jgi:hypothetical protein
MSIGRAWSRVHRVVANFYTRASAKIRDGKIRPKRGSWDRLDPRHVGDGLRTNENPPELDISRGRRENETLRGNF